MTITITITEADKMLEQTSNCCKALITVDSADAGTSCFMCAECGRSCDLFIDKQKFLKSRGWFLWYNENYWCHEQFGCEERDCTNWGLPLDNAYGFETNPAIREKILSGMDLMFNARKAFSNLGMNESKAIIFGYDVATPESPGKSIVVIDEKEYDRLKKIEKDCEKLEKIKEENKELLSALKELDEFNGRKRLDENIKKMIEFKKEDIRTLKQNLNSQYIIDEIQEEIDRLEDLYK